MNHTLATCVRYSPLQHYLSRAQRAPCMLTAVEALLRFLQKLKITPASMVVCAFRLLFRFHLVLPTLALELESEKVENCVWRVIHGVHFPTPFPFHSANHSSAPAAQHLSTRAPPSSTTLRDTFAGNRSVRRAERRGGCNHSRGWWG